MIISNVGNYQPPVQNFNNNLPANIQQNVTQPAQNSVIPANIQQNAIQAKQNISGVANNADNANNGLVVSNSQNSIKAQPATDTFVSQNKKELTKKQKVAIGVAIAVGIGALVAGIIHKRKVDTKSVKQLAEHIDFKNAENLDDAIKFGKETLGIKRYKGFTEADLDVVNWVNEGIVNVNNKTKGKAIMPKKVVFASLEDIGAGMNFSGTLTINKVDVNSNKNMFVDYVNNHVIGDAEQKAKFLDKKDLYKKAMMFAVGKDGKNLKQGTHVSTFGVISHEMGHLQHFSALGDSKFALSLGKSHERPKELAKGTKELLELFENSKDVTSKVSKYAQESPLEFVAECYSKMTDGIKLDDDVMALYKKFRGASI